MGLDGVKNQAAKGSESVSSVTHYIKRDSLQWQDLSSSQSSVKL